ncbi:MAG: ABC transporter permease [Gemmatimonadetes bacterium]|nr:ABC transporter permease [Gemmatimonadota bacterium]
MAERTRGGVALSAVLPGVPQMLAGRVWAGATALWMWLGALALFVSRPERISAEFGAGSGTGRAALGVLLAAGLAWAWSLRDVGETPRSDSRRPGPLARLYDDAWGAGGLFVLGVFGWLLVAVPLLTPESGLRSLAFEPFLTPRWANPMGTDRVAADVYHRFLLGARSTLGVGILAGLAGAALGVAVGSIAGFFGGRADRVLMRVVDFFIALPKLVLLIAVVGVLEPSPLVLGLFIAFVQWPALARIVRGEVAALREREFVKALGALGFSRSRILLGHVLPNVQATVLVGSVLAVANAMLIEAGLGFLGLGMGGAQYEASWGVLIRDGADLGSHWWIGGFAGLSLVAVVVALNLVADAVRDEFDPRARLSV